MRKVHRIIAVCVIAAMAFQLFAPAPGVFALEANAFADTLSAISQYAANASDASQNVEGADSANGGASSGSAEAGPTGSGKNSSGAAQGEAEGLEGEGSSGNTAGGESLADEDADVFESDEAGGAVQNDVSDEVSEGDGERAETQAASPITTLDELKTALGTHGEASGSGNVASTIKVNDATALLIVSNADSSIYSTATISKGGSTGTAFDLSGEADGYSFQGFGSEKVPFAGKINLDGVTLSVSRTLYNGLSLTANNSTIALTWKGAGSDPILAKKIVGNGQKLDATITIADSGAQDPQESDAGITGALLGSVVGDLTVSASYSFSGTRKGIGIESTADNAGLLVNTLESDTLTIENLDGISDARGTPKVSTSADNCASGGLIGCVENGASVKVAGSIDVSNLTVTATGTNGAAGGFIGMATKLGLSFTDGASVKPAQKVGDANTTYAGGAIGYISFAGDPTLKAGQIDFGDSTVELGATRRAGGLFGRLDVSNGDVEIQGGTYKSKLALGADNSGTSSERGSYGGIAGTVCSTSSDTIHDLTVGKNDDSATQIEIERASNLCYVGGVVGYLGENSDASAKKTVAAVLDGAEVTVKGNATAYTNNAKFGGAMGVVDSNNVLDIRDFKLTSINEIGKDAQGGSAGIAGSCWEGVIRFSGATDLSGAKFADGNKTAQLVFQNSNSLIFATGSGSDGGWTLKRSNTPSTVDDIFDYGEVIRLGGNGVLSESLITLDNDTHRLSYAPKLTKTGDAFTLTSADDFAKLAITWQSSGHFSLVNGVTSADFSGNKSPLSSATINVTGSIDLSGTGLTGLTKDPASGWSWSEGSEKWTFTGALTGSGSVKLAVGEPYGMRNGSALGPDDASAGNGKIYRHSYLGLFAIVGANATVENVTVGGTMRFDNKNDVSAGALAATFNGVTDLTVSHATFETKISYDGTADGKDLNVGGVLGSVEGSGKVTFGGSTKVTGSITARDQDKNSSRVGGVIGYVKGDIQASVDVAGLTIGGSISIPDYKKQALAGGFIGYIEQGEKTKSINITDLAFNGFSLSTDAKSTDKKYAGGLLGYSWGNTEVVFGGSGNTESNFALRVNDSCVTAANATEFGGLVYAASGSWTVGQYGINLNGLTLNAPAAEKFGMLVCRGGSAGENETIGVDALTGLYVKNTADWAKSYWVDENANAISTSAATFDEWVADACRTGAAVDECGVNGMVSLHTKANVVDMSGDTTKLNSYENRTGYGRSHKTNKNTRYYYNLDRAYDAVKDNGSDKTNGENNWMSTPEDLMLWSARLYAADGIKKYIADDTWTLYQGVARIGNTSTSIDMTGYSYYPVDTSGSDVIIKDCTIKFCYSQIKTEEQNNKSNASETQHLNMHTGLIRSVTPAGENRVKLSVQRLTLTGSVGLDAKNGGSGALVSLDAAGSTANTNSIVETSIDGLVLDGLVVDGVDMSTEYAPLLVNKMSAHASLTVKNLSVGNGSYSNGTKAATSLFGRLGGEDAELVTAALSNNVCVPSYKDESIFTRATFLESFGYKEGSSGSSANYIFYKGDKVTYGKEIDSQGGEYEGLQLWYYDASLHGYDSGLVEDNAHNVKASKTTPSFGNYLPYVYKGKYGTAYHEIKVNQRVASLETGCGTYADPYVVSSAKELYAAADYINNAGSVVDGWRATIIDSQVDESGSPVVCNRRAAGGNNEHEVTYVYSSASSLWVKDGDSNATLDNDTMHRYLQSAYYSIEPKNDKGAVSDTLVLDAERFNGLGNKANPFRGVLVGNLSSDSKISRATVKIENPKGTQKGLIPYSYGSVVKDLIVKYSGNAASVAYAQKDANTGVPESFFGGVIGCIMGGDNIIDNVQVKADSGFSVSALGDKSHLVPVGGYVGAIAGGGVIFRNMEDTDDSWRSETKDTGGLYDNPYVGRVIDGYAFSEGCEIDNGDANYKVNKLDTTDTGCITTGQLYPRDHNSENKAVTTTVNDAQGLLILSAIINSGAAAGPTQASEAYYGNYYGVAAYKGTVESAAEGYAFGNGGYGKVRNATYAEVGKPSEAAADFAVAVSDDRKTPGAQSSCASNAVTNQTEVNSPYLVAKYASKLTGYICAPNVSGMDLQFANNTTYDMRSYGSGFLGLSGRYYSNACNGGEKGQDRDRIVPAIGCINGNGSTILVNNNFQQYTDDDYSVQAVGGLFGAITFTNLTGSVEANGGYVVKDLQFGDGDKATEGAKSSSVSLTFLDSNGSAASKDGDNYLVGMLAGTTANRDSLSTSGKYSNVRLKSCSVKSPKIAGGLLGASGWARSDRRDTVDTMVYFTDDGTSDDSLKQSPAKLLDCSYDGIEVKGGSRVGGFVGAAGSGSTIAAWATGKDLQLGSNSTIEASAAGCIAGGVVGLSWSSVEINQLEGQGQEFKTVKLTDVKIVDNYWVSNDSLCGTGGIVGNPKAGCKLSNVTVESTKEASSTDATYIGSLNPNNSYKRAGGLVGQIDTANNNGAYSFDTIMLGKIRIGVHDSGAAIVGSIRNGIGITCNDIEISDCQIDGQWSGGIVGAINADNGGSGNRSSVTLTNSTLRNNIFVAKNTGGVAGDGRGTFRLSNVLFDSNTFNQASANGQGVILGIVDIDWNDNGGQFKGLYASGIDIVPASGATTVPSVVRAANDGILREVNKRSYIAFADYNDTFDQVDGAALYNDKHADDGSMLAVDSASPYVTTSPVSSLGVKASATSDAKKLFGDGAAIDTAATIQSDASKSVAGRYTYTNIGGIDGDGNYQNVNSYDASKSQSTFNESNPASAQAATDFKVLLIPGNDTTTVTDYLNLVTNGGFSDAVRLNGTNGAKVSATVQMVKLQDGAFVASDETPSLSVVGNETTNMSFRASTAWDNDQSRFTLLTVTFDSRTGHTYKVQVPIVVKRMLEIDFSATYTYGTNYKSSNYDALKDHVLIGMGDAMTGYLTWTYDEALGDDTVRYGLDTHLAGGGKLTPVAKSIVFSGDQTSGVLPAGTQLTLVDCAHNNKQYTCTVTEGDTVTSGADSATSVALTKFVDSEGAAYQEQWLSELMGVTAKQSASGGWVKMNNPSDDDIADKAVAKVDGDYYRLAASGETASASDRFDLALAEEKPVSESFYVIVRVPTGASKNVNGFTTSSATADVNYHINDVHRYDPSQKDGHSNNESTYSVASGYEQELVDNRNTNEEDNVIKMQLDDTDTVYKNLQLDVTDTITLGNNEYNGNDDLYFQLDSSLAKFENGASIGAVGYPSGAKIDASFYVKVGDGYYVWENSGWVNKGATEVAAVSKTVTANGNDLSLILSDANGNAINLKEIREKAKDGNKVFTVQVKANVELTEPQCQAVIMASQDGSAGYTKPTYRSFLSTHADTLSTSSTTADDGGKVRYYRQDVGASTIALVASKKTQLGINVNDLSSADGTIALVGTYDFSKLNGAEAKIDKATELTYTLTLQQRQDDGSYRDVDNITNYVTVNKSDHLSVGTVSADGKSIIFTDTKGADGFATRDGASLAFRHRFEVKVKTDVEDSEHFYANYRLVLTARLSGDGVEEEPVNADNISGYTNSDYVTYWLSKIKIDGISHAK